jgi:hypothetical protein
MALVAASMAIQAVLLNLTPHGPWLWESDIPLWVGIGYVVPALIAHDMDRQGIGNTVRAVLTTGVLVAIPVMLALFWLRNDTAATGSLANFDSVLLPPQWVPVAVILSAASAWALLHNHGLRQGGFIGAAYVGMLWAGPAQVMFIFAVALTTWFVVTKVMMPKMLLFGRRKFATMLIVAGIVSWLGLWLGVTIFGVSSTAYATIASIPLTPVFVPGLLANDMERSGVARVVVGTTVGALFTLPATLALIELFGEQRTGRLVALALAGLAAGSFIFSSQFKALFVRIGRRLEAVGANVAYAALGREYSSHDFRS